MSGTPRIEQSIGEYTTDDTNTTSSVTPPGSQTPVHVIDEDVTRLHRIFSATSCDSAGRSETPDRVIRDLSCDFMRLLAKYELNANYTDRIATMDRDELERMSIGLLDMLSAITSIYENGTRRRDVRKMSQYSMQLERSSVVSPGDDGTREYTYVSPIGCGKNGAVSQYMKDGVRYAIKRVHGRYASNMLKEASALARVSHKNVVRVYEYIKCPRWSLIVMEYFEGEPIYDFADMTFAMFGEEIISGVIDGLACIHSHGIIHGDISCSNILYSLHTGEVKIIDFGCATSSSFGGYTGTPFYRSPESHVLTYVPSMAQDIWALGVALYYARTSHHPFCNNAECLDCSVTDPCTYMADEKLNPRDLCADEVDFYRVMLNKSGALRPGIEDIRILFARIQLKEGSRVQNRLYRQCTMRIDEHAGGA